MADRFRIVAHFMGEEDVALTRGLSPDLDFTPAFATGPASEPQIAGLRDAGLVVEILGPLGPDGKVERPGEPETPGRGAEAVAGPDAPESARGRRSLTVSTHPIAPSAEDVPDLAGPLTHLVRIDGPFLEAYREELGRNGVRLEQGFRNGYYTARIDLDQAEALRSLPFVLAVTRYDGGETGSGTGATRPESLGDSAAQPGYARMVTYDIRLHRPEDADAVRAWLDANHVAVAGASGRKIRIYALDGSDVVARLWNLDGVQRVEEFVEPRLWNDRAGQLIGTRAAAALPYDGTGQIVGVADTGLDDTHGDFAGRIVTAIPLGRPGRTDDPHGHGTHVAGSVLGSGAGSNGAFAGTAPRAKLVFQSVLDAGGGLGGLPLDLADLFSEAYSHGARIHNNSWGSDTFSTYTMESEDVDAYVAHQRDMFVVFAAGNEGQGSDLRNSSQGFVEWLSVGSPATAKNCLTVGASRGDRTSGGLSAQTYGTVWGADFPHQPLSGETVSGDPEEMAGFSSRGPSDDRRIKPDLVAPGTDIFSCRSTKAPARNFWGLDPTHPTYAYMGGTSMAAPLVAGCAALARQYFVDERDHRPSAALLRATLVNGTRWLSGQHSNSSNLPGAVPEGNFDQGFGRLDMAATLPHPGNPDLRLAFVDNWEDQGDRFTATGDVKRWAVQVEGGGLPLRVCLAYTDLPARALQNNLNLFVRMPDGTRFFGNQQLRMGLRNPDGDNNVEVVRIAAPAKGPYLLQVTAQNLLEVPQDFALVVTGHLRSNVLTPV